MLAVLYSQVGPLAGLCITYGWTWLQVVFPGRIGVTGWSLPLGGAVSWTL